MVIYLFFFQAEDGIRDIGVTGVQTCALPISGRDDEAFDGDGTRCGHGGSLGYGYGFATMLSGVVRGGREDSRCGGAQSAAAARSEQRRVGKECRSRGCPYHLKKTISSVVTVS